MSAFIQEKELVVNEIKEKLDRASSAVVVDYRGITVAEADLLRRRMREANVEYKIYKNTMKWSEGSTWKYDYETFVALDQAGRSQAAGRLRAPRTRSTEEELDRQHEETHIPPVTVDEGVLEVGFPVSGPAVPHFKRK